MGKLAQLLMVHKPGDERNEVQGVKLLALPRCYKLLRATQNVDYTLITRGLEQSEAQTVTQL